MKNDKNFYAVVVAAAAAPLAARLPVVGAAVVVAAARWPRSNAEARRRAAWRKEKLVEEIKKQNDDDEPFSNLYDNIFYELFVEYWSKLDENPLTTSIYEDVLRVFSCLKKQVDIHFLQRSKWKWTLFVTFDIAGGENNSFAFGNGFNADHFWMDQTV